MAREICYPAKKGHRDPAELFETRLCVGDLYDISDIPGRIEIGEVGSNIPDISCVGEYQLDQDQL